MTTTAQTWFYKQPEPNAYAIGERVRTNFWEARLGGLWLDCVKPEPPIRMKGWWNAGAVEMEWEPGKWLTLRTQPAAPQLADGLNQMLGLKAAFTYEDAEGRTVWEWHTDGGSAQWQTIQGIPAYRHPKWLGK